MNYFSYTHVINQMRLLPKTFAVLKKVQTFFLSNYMTQHTRWRGGINPLQAHHAISGILI